MKHRPLKSRNFRSAGEDAAKAKPPSLYDGPGSAYHLAFTDIDFLLQSSSMGLPPAEPPPVAPVFTASPTDPPQPASEQI